MHVLRLIHLNFFNSHKSHSFHSHSHSPSTTWATNSLTDCHTTSIISSHIILLNADFTCLHGAKYHAPPQQTKATVNKEMGNQL